MKLISHFHSVFIYMAVVVASLACQTLTRGVSSDPAIPSSNPAQNSNGQLSMDWLVTTDELNSFSTDIGILDWVVLQDTPGENRICRTFQGTSWSATPNEGLNCIFKVVEGASIKSVTDSMFNDGRLFAGSQPVNTNLKLDGEYVLYAGDHPNGHAVFDLILVRGNLMYWSSVTLGVLVGETPQTIYQSTSQALDAFLLNVININLSKIN